MFTSKNFKAAPDTHTDTHTHTPDREHVYVCVLGRGGFIDLQAPGNPVLPFPL